MFIHNIPSIRPDSVKQQREQSAEQKAQKEELKRQRAILAEQNKYRPLVEVPRDPRTTRWRNAEH
jgi:hypothetical protein